MALEVTSASGTCWEPELHQRHWMLKRVENMCWHGTLRDQEIGIHWIFAETKSCGLSNRFFGCPKGPHCHKLLELGHIYGLFAGDPLHILALHSTSVEHNTAAIFKTLANGLTLATLCMERPTHTTTCTFRDRTKEC